MSNYFDSFSSDISGITSLNGGTWCYYNGRILSGDFNGDGRYDLLCNDINGGNFILISTVNGFTPIFAQTTFVSIAGHDSWCDYKNGRKLIVEDFNGDNLNDLWCNDENSNNFISLFFDNRFISINSDSWGKISIGNSFIWCHPSNGRILSGDFNGDGKSDLLCNDVNGDNFFAISTGLEFLSTSNTLHNWCHFNDKSTIISADFNGDGKFDLLCNDKDGYNFIMLHIGSESFRSINSNNSFGKINIGGSDIWCPQTYGRILSGDFNGDGKADLLCNDINSNNYIVLSDGENFSNTIPALTNWCTKNSDTRIIVADFTGDGKDDLWCNNNGNNYFQFSTISISPITGSTSSISPSPAASISPTASISVFAPQSIFFTSPNNAAPSGEISLGNGRWCYGTKKIITGDLNGDNLADLMCNDPESLSSANNFILINQENGFFRTSTNSQDGDIILGNNRWCYGAQRIIMGDFDNNGKDDILCNNPETTASSPNNFILLSNNNDFISITSNRDDGRISLGYGAWCYGEQRIFTGDFNGDGKSDLACYEDANSFIYILLSTGTGFISINNEITGLINLGTENWCPSSLYARVVTGDFNGDGKSDLLCNKGTYPSVEPNNQILLSTGTNFISIRNNANGQIALGTGVWCNDPNARVLAGDFNGDRKSDLLCNGAGDNYILLSTGNNFVPLSSRVDGKISLGANSKWCWDARMFVADFNADGQADLFCSSTDLNQSDFNNNILFSIISASYSPSSSISTTPFPSSSSSTSANPMPNQSDDSNGKSFIETASGIGTLVGSIGGFVSFVVSIAFAIRYCHSKHKTGFSPGAVETAKAVKAFSATPIGMTLEEGKEISLITIEESKIYYDYENDGKSEKTSWVSGDDAILVYDHNNNKQVDKAEEIVLSHWCPRLRDRFCSNALCI